MRGFVVASVCIALSLSGLARAVEIERLEVEREGDVYSIDLSVRSVAPVAALRALLTDYAHLDRLHPFIRSSQILASDNPQAIRVRTESKVCVYIFCKDLLRVEDVTEGSDGDLSAVIVPQTGSLRAGRSDWRFESLPDGSRIHHVSSMVPDFFVPPLIGPVLLKRGLKKELTIMIQNMERLAAGHAKAP